MRITEENYVDEAEKVIIELKDLKDKNGKTIQMVTTSKIRNLLAMSADIYNEVMALPEDKLSQDLNSRIQYLRVRFMYECGREKAVKNFVEKSGLTDVLKNVNGSKKNYILFNRYMESLVAFHKYYGGKDN